MVEEKMKEKRERIAEKGEDGGGGRRERMGENRKGIEKKYRKNGR